MDSLYMLEAEVLYDAQKDDLGEITEPFNPKDVDIINVPMVVSNIVDRLKDDRIILDPGFQRRPGLWDDEKQSRLIESLIVRIPLPSFYFDYDESDHYIVVDGLQRLWAIKRYIALDEKDPNRLRLKGLEYLKEFEGKLFEELPSIIQRRIREQTFVTYVIRPGTPEYVRNSIFTRINTGGIQLTPPEIKNSIYRGQAADLLKELAHSDAFIQATNNRVDPSRMLDCELVNRFLAFYVLGTESYKGNLEMYLNQVLKKLKDDKSGNFESYKKAFYEAMDLAHMLFEDKAFRRIQGNGQFGKINKPLFECVSVCLANLTDQERRKLLERKNIFLEKYYAVLKEKGFIRAITNGTAKKTSIEKRYGTMRWLIQESLK